MASGSSNYQKISFDKRITIKRPTVVVDSNYGTEKETLTDWVTVWGQEEDTAQGSERERDGQIIAKQKISFLIRWRQSLLKTDVIAYDSELYDIQFIQKVGRRQYMKLVCVLRDNQ